MPWSHRSEGHNEYKCDNTAISNPYQELPISKIDPHNKLPPIDTIARKIEAESDYEKRSKEKLELATRRMNGEYITVTGEKRNRSPKENQKPSRSRMSPEELSMIISNHMNSDVYELRNEHEENEIDNDNKDEAEDGAVGRCATSTQ